MHSRFCALMNGRGWRESPDKPPRSGVTRIAGGGAQREPPVARRNQQEPRSGAMMAHNWAMVMPLRGMGRTILLPGVALRSTPGYSGLAAPRHQ